MKVFKNKYIWITLAIILIVAAVVLARSTGSSEKIHTVKTGPFERLITVKGEIQGKNAVLITLPDELNLRDLHLYQIKINDLVQEGKMVKQGEWVATLDDTEIKKRMQDNMQDLNKSRAELNDAKIDSTIQLTDLREELREFKYDLEYQKIELEQAKYESPAYQRKKQMDYNQLLRQMEKKRRDYKLKELDLKMKTRRIEERFERLSDNDAKLKRAIAATRVTSPKDGMIIYAKDYWGRKLKAGDMVSYWRPELATLPDMSVLVSETYIKEIDISKISVGDSVEITIDALAGKTYNGFISRIANIGQELPGFDTKVFKVFIDLEQKSKEIKPAMSTINNIVVESYPDVLKIPRKCLFTRNGDSFVFFKQEGKTWKKRVTPGTENEEEVIIESGLKENQKILLDIPENAEEIPFYTES